MMNERQRVKVLEQLSAFLDGQLDETEQRQIESRLANEPELKDMYEAYTIPSCSSAACTGCTPRDPSL